MSLTQSEKKSNISHAKAFSNTQPIQVFSQDNMKVQSKPICAAFMEKRLIALGDICFPMSLLSEFFIRQFDQKTADGWWFDGDVFMKNMFSVRTQSRKKYRLNFLSLIWIWVLRESNPSKHLLDFPLPRHFLNYGTSIIKQLSVLANDTSFKTDPWYENNVKKI